MMMMLLRVQNRYLRWRCGMSKEELSALSDKMKARVKDAVSSMIDDDFDDDEELVKIRTVLFAVCEFWAASLLLVGIALGSATLFVGFWIWQ